MWQNVWESPQYELVVNIIGIFNILCIVVRQVNLTNSTDFLTIWIGVQFIINLIFMIEVVSDWCLHGFL